MNEWTYWRPLEGTHVLHPNELHVGIVNEKNEPLLIAAVVPAVMGDQMEPFALAIVDALRAKSVDWTRPDHLADGLAARGFPLGRLDWPHRSSEAINVTVHPGPTFDDGFAAGLRRGYEEGRQRRG